MTVEGQMVFLTKRVMWRESRLRPSRKLNCLFRYTAFKVAKRYGISICAMVVMSNHWHAVLFDRFGKASKFAQDVHSQVARELGKNHGELGGIWDRREPHLQVLADREAVLEKMAYTLGNPSKHGAVKYSRSWPGVRLAWPRQSRAEQRPEGFHRSTADGGTAPDHVMIEPTRPAGFDDVPDNELARMISERAAAFERSIREERAEAGKGFLGRAAVLRQSRHARATSKEPRFRRIPRVSAGCPEKRMTWERKNREFQRDYRAALERWKAGERDVIFPYGTYKMRVLHGVRVAPPT